MARIIVLGSSSAVPDPEHENTHILVEAENRTILVDCPGSPVVRLNQAAVNPNKITDIILTHFHPDHVSGYPPLLMGMWLTGRREPVNVYGLKPTIDRAKQMMDLYDWREWPDFYPINYFSIPDEEQVTVLRDKAIWIKSSPVQHLIPTLGLRFEFLQEGKTLAYSCDTEPSQVVCRLAENADILIHEATGTGVGHTSADQAGTIATQAKVKQLYLIHYPPQLTTPAALIEKASRTFHGPVTVAKDLLEIPLG